MLGAGRNKPSYIPGLKGHGKSGVVFSSISLWFQGAHAEPQATGGQTWMSRNSRLISLSMKELIVVPK